MILVRKVRFLVSDPENITYLKERSAWSWVCHVIKSWVLLDCTVYLTAEESQPTCGTLNFNVINWRFAKRHEVLSMREHRRFLDGRKLWRRLLA